MRLLFAPTSPFARKVRVAAIELGLGARIAAVPVDPWSDAGLRALNPLAKVPVLLREDGRAIAESAVICEYLDHLAGGRLFPPAGEPRWQALALQGVADGMSTAAGRLFADERRPDNERSSAVMRRQAAAIEAGLDRLAAEAAALSPVLADIGAVAAACALGYLDFRWPERDWRHGRDGLARWAAVVAARPSMAATRHALPG
ncbi:glutathione S-transferase N-terminal domain-containing protein [Roseomonas sp. BN140053]|uniref:glutathione S-transferase N-terminal domain-containing protein n=1 Tax=Roseomonas sp. BN140053 TaxID=3391898 RepID=UPI0039E8FF9D